ncbi:MAG: helix-turn-helix domain-containing protein [Brachymonas sp.]
MARQLLSLVRQHGRLETDGVIGHVSLPQDKLAQSLAVKCQSIKKILKTWDHEGWLLQHRGKITLRNLAALGSQAELPTQDL